MDFLFFPTTYFQRNSFTYELTPGPAVSREYVDREGYRYSEEEKIGIIIILHFAVHFSRAGAMTMYFYCAISVLKDEEN